MQSNEKKPSAEALAVAPTASAEQPAPKSATPDTVEVVLSHPSWGSHSFRAEESKIAHRLSGELAAAKRAAAKREQVAAIDKAQDEVHAEIARAKARVAAAELLGDKAGQAKHQAEVEALQKHVSELSSDRAKVMEAE